MSPVNLTVYISKAACSLQVILSTLGMFPSGVARATGLQHASKLIDESVGRMAGGTTEYIFLLEMKQG